MRPAEKWGMIVKVRPLLRGSESSIARAYTTTIAPLQLTPLRASAYGNGAGQQHIDTVIWTAIGPRFSERTGTPFSVNAAIRYLGLLTEPTKTSALEYIRNAPPEVVTPVRTKVEAVFP
jgi:hypothetical protein